VARLSDVLLSEALFGYNLAVFNCLVYGYSVQDSTANKLCFLKSFSKSSSAFAKDEVRGGKKKIKKINLSTM